MKYEKGKRAKCVKGRKTKDGGQMSQLPMANLQPPFATCHLPPAIRYVLFATRQRGVRAEEAVYGVDYGVHVQATSQPRHLRRLKVRLL